MFGVVWFFSIDINLGSSLAPQSSTRLLAESVNTINIVLPLCILYWLRESQVLFPLTVKKGGNSYSKSSHPASVCCLGFRNFLVPSVRCHPYTQVSLRLERCCYSVEYYSIKHNYHGFLWTWHLLLVKIPYMEQVWENQGLDTTPNLSLLATQPMQCCLLFKCEVLKKNHIFDEPWRLAQETWNKLFINYWNQLIENIPQPSQKEMLLPRCTTWSLPSFRTSWKSTKCFKLPKIIIYKKEKAYYIWQMYFNFKHAESLAEKNKTRQKNKIP